MILKTILFIGGILISIYYINDIKNIKRYAGYQNTYKGLDKHLTRIAGGFTLTILGIFL